MRARRRALLRPAAAALACAVFCVPLAVMVLGALHPPGQSPPVGSELLAGPWSLDAFDRAFELAPLWRQMLNSLTVVAVAVPLTVVVVSLAGFAMTLLPPRARHLAVGFTLVTLTIPISALWVPRFAIFRTLGMLDTYVPLVAPALAGTSPFLVLLAYWSARRIPRELVEAARLEGLGPLRTWWQVAVPLTRPTLFAVAALAFVAHWSNFVEPLLYLFDPDKATLPIGVAALRTLGPTEVAVVLAGALVATVPPVVAFALAQRRFFDDARGAGWVRR